MGGSSGGGRGELNSEINVTPMVDVMLVLLVIFMVTAPLMTGVDVDLPQADAPAVRSAEGQLTLSIQQGSKLFLSGKELPWVGLQAALEADPRLKVTKELQVEADKDLPYSVVVTAMAVARQAGVTKLQMVTDPGAKLDLATLDQAAAVAAPTGAAP